MKTFLQEHLSEILTAIAGAFAWIFERRKRKIEERKKLNALEHSETVTKKDIVDLYQEVLDDLKERYDGIIEEVQKEMSLLKKNQELWKNKYSELKKEFEIYRQKHP